ncbi:MAG: hypothetical protein KDC38_08930, partial [Planctomycetes bacterium]|nr:hypothetical protein [Planctomycetota bacterium]
MRRDGRSEPALALIEKCRRTAAVWLALSLCAASMTLAQVPAMRVKNTVHNLSTSGPGTIRATTESRICVFCHTPHNSVPNSPLWNRAMPTATYQIYSSPSLTANVGQPTGSSKLCLSCHDGTIALGSVLSSPTPISMTGGVTTLIGDGNLGTDLSDDHPISFVYQDALSGSNPEFVSRPDLPPQIRLDDWGEVQCTSCHDPHDNTNGNFLVTDAT